MAADAAARLAAARRRAPGLLAALAISAAAHAALFGLADAIAGFSAAPRQVAPTDRLLLRVAVASAVGNETAAGAAIPAIDDSSRSRPAENAVETLPAAEPDSAVVATGTQPQPPARQAEPDSHQPIGVDGYLPRSALSRPPLPLEEIDLRWPAGIFTLERQVATFWMFVDESGIVRRFEADGPTLAPQLEDTARRTFLAARFDPGQRDGRPVKSLIRIEVVFDNRPSDAAPTVVAERFL